MVWASRKRKKKNSRFIMFQWDLWDSWAWEQLTNAARVAYWAILRNKNRPNKDEIVLTFDQGERLMGRHTFQKAIDQLLDLGFIVMKQRGGPKRRTNIYSLSEEWRFRSEKKK